MGRHVDPLPSTVLGDSSSRHRQGRIQGHHRVSLTSLLGQHRCRFSSVRVDAVRLVTASEGIEPLPSRPTVRFSLRAPQLPRHSPCYRFELRRQHVVHDRGHSAHRLVARYRGHLHDRPIRSRSAGYRTRPVRGGSLVRTPNGGMTHRANDRIENSGDLPHPRARSIAKGAQPLQANIRAVAEIEQGALNRRTFADRFSDAVTHATGSAPFALAHLGWFMGWLVINTGHLFRVKPFDPYPFSFLTLVVSLEAIFLTVFVL